jgi:hypothetical protein
MRIEPRDALQKRRFALIKEAVTIPMLGEHLGMGWKKAGQRWRGECPVCRNGSTSDAFSASETLWFCHACHLGGDVVDLARHEADMYPAQAVAWLGEVFKVDLPMRPDSWFRKQDRQARMREAEEEAKRIKKRRRLFKYIAVPQIEATTPPEDVKDEIRWAWENLYKDLPV